MEDHIRRSAITLDQVEGLNQNGPDREKRKREGVQNPCARFMELVVSIY
jgi:hypothetical protein